MIWFTIMMAVLQIGKQAQRGQSLAQCHTAGKSESLGSRQVSVSNPVSPFGSLPPSSHDHPSAQLTPTFKSYSKQEK